MVMAKPQKEDTITYDTLKRLIGASQARHIWEQKRVAEVGVLYDEAALRAMHRLMIREQLPVAADIRAAAPAIVAYFREAFPNTRATAREWARRRMNLPNETVSEPRAQSARVPRQPYNIVKLTPELLAERDEALRLGLGWCPNHSTRSERIQPPGNFWKNRESANGLMHRCKECLRVQRSTSSKNRTNSLRGKPATPAKLEALRKGHAILARTRQLRAAGVPDLDALNQARKEWANQTNGGVKTDDLPPVPEDTERPYEAELDESELVAVTSGEEVYQ